MTEGLDDCTHHEGEDGYALVDKAQHEALRADKEMSDQTQGPSETCCKMWAHIEDIIPAQETEV